MQIREKEQQTIIKNININQRKLLEKKDVTKMSVEVEKMRNKINNGLQELSDLDKKNRRERKLLIIVRIQTKVSSSRQRLR